MFRLFRLLTSWVLAALVFSACQPITLPPTPVAQPPQGLRPDVPAYGIRGPHAVGARDFSIDAGEHTVDITVWYPALNPTNAPETITYQISEKLGDVALQPITGRALADAQPDAAQGPYPLVIFSPGLAGWRQANSYLLEHLASYGLVAIAADPRGETFEEFWQGAATRPLDLRTLIAYADQLTAADGQLAGLIDMTRIAMVGHSSGGWAALVGGGAQMSFGWCAANPDLVAENDLSNCTQFVPHADEIAASLGLTTTPAALWPPMNDPRVAAVVALAPDGDIWGADYEGAAALQVPTLIMAGTGDTVNPPERCAYPIYEQLGSAKKSLITFADGWHMIFFNQCKDTPWLAIDSFAFCSDAVWDMDRVHDLINHFMTAFLLAELKGDTEASAALAPANVTFPGIQYETTAYTVTIEAAATVPVTGYAEVNGTRLYYEMAGTGDPVILLHGFGCDSRYWQAQFEALAQQYQVVRYDLRGFGKSDLPGTDPYTHADDLKALLDYLGIARAHIIGHSFGGENAINFALAYPATTRSLILIDNDVQGAEGLPASTPEEDAAWATIFAALEKGDKQAAAEAVLDRHPLFVVARTMPAVRDLQVDMFADYSWWHLTGGVDPVQVSAVPAVQRLGEIQAPTLVIIGELDNEYQQVMVEIAVQGIPGAQKVVMPSLDHSPFLEDPEGFNQLVLEFLAGK